MNDKLPPKGTTELAPLVGDGTDDLLVFGFQEVGESDESPIVPGLEAEQQMYAVRHYYSPKATIGRLLGRRHYFVAWVIRVETTRRYD